MILHGFSESMETWAEVVCHLPRQNHVLLLDLPGHGNAPLKFTSGEIMLMTCYVFYDWIFTIFSMHDSWLRDRLGGGYLTVCVALIIRRWTTLHCMELISGQIRSRIVVHPS